MCHLPRYNIFPYTTLFRSRLDDISTDGMTLISDIIEIYQNYGLETEVLAASTDRKSTPLNSSHVAISYAVFCLKKKNTNKICSKLRKTVSVFNQDSCNLII